jgi:hypothetical protein
MVGFPVKLDDPKFNNKDLTGSHKVDYIKGQITYFSLIALDVLGYQVTNLGEIENFLKDNRKTEEWYKSLDLSHFWYESNKIMFLMYFFFYIQKYGYKNQSEIAKENIKLLIDLLNSTQDKQTGFWGTNLNGNNLYDGCFGSAHIYLFYDFLGIEIPNTKKIIDSTLKLHCGNGLVKHKHGGACEDYDAVDIYLRCLNQTDYRKSEVFDVLYKMRNVIKSSQNKDGGFPYRIAGNFLEQFIYNHLLKRTYTYSGWRIMKTKSFQSDLWATWFRNLSLKVIDYLLDEKENFNSYSLPAWGYIKKV